MKPCIVLLHGVGTSPALWDGVLATLPESEFERFTPELGGLALEHPTFEGLVAALDAACPQGAVVAASSFACNFAIALAAVRSDLRGLVLSGVGPLRIDETRRAQLDGLVAPIEHMNPDIAAAFVDALAPSVSNADDVQFTRERLKQLLLAPGRIEGNVAMLRLTLPDLDAFVRGSRVPMVVLHGTADTTVDPGWSHAWVETAAEGLASLHELESVGHYPELHHPERVASLIRDFAGRTDPAPTEPSTTSSP